MLVRAGQRVGGSLARWHGPASEIRLGLRENAGQFALLVGVSALVGGMVGQERTIVPLLGVQAFGLSTATAALSFLIAFGLTKAVTNLVAGAMADRVGRKPVLVAGWLIGLPVPFLLILAPDWGWVVAANILLGVNQGLTWSTTVLMKIDLVGPRQPGPCPRAERGGGLPRRGRRRLPDRVDRRVGRPPTDAVLPGHRDRRPRARGVGPVRSRDAWSRPARERAARGDRTADPHWLRLAWRSTVTDRSLSAACQAGLVNNLNDAMAWGLLPIVQAAAGLPIAQIGLLAGAYPATWGIAQIATGALSDRIGRKRLIVAGMLAQAFAIAAIAATTGFGPWLAAAVLLGLGTAMVYPTLIAVVADVAEPRRRGAVTGVYRFWRDIGFAVGAILVGLLADRFDARVAILAVAALTAASGVIVAIRMRETRPAL